MAKVYTEYVPFFATKGLAVRIAEQCEKADISRSELMRRAVVDYLDKEWEKERYQVARHA